MWDSIKNNNTVAIVIENHIIKQWWGYLMSFLMDFGQQLRSKAQWTELNSIYQALDTQAILCRTN